MTATAVKHHKQRTDREKAVMDGLVHFMRRNGMTLMAINRAMRKSEQLLNSFQSAMQVTLKARRVSDEQILGLIGPIPKD